MVTRDAQLNLPLEPSPKRPSVSLLKAPVVKGDDGRVMSAWCAWLDALATNAEAAMAAALAYKQLEGAARDSWLTAVETDIDRTAAPRIAVFAPLLAVESDPLRRARITRAMGPVDEMATPRVGATGLLGIGRDGLRVAVVVTPLYLEFVQVLACAFRTHEGFQWVRHDPIVDRVRGMGPGDCVDGVVLESVPLKSLVDELAHAVVAHVRMGHAVPEGLSCFADLFDALGVDSLSLPVL
jgi:hypothetical protein